MSDPLRDFAERAGFPLCDSQWLSVACTHSSWANEHREPYDHHNERLEFLGDSVLQLSVSAALFQLTPHLMEGKMSKIRSQLVCETTLAEIAHQIGLGDQIRWGKGEDTPEGRARPSVLADALEAVIGSIFMDQGFEVAKDWVHKILSPYVDEALQGRLITDYKSAFLEKVAMKKLPYAVEFVIVKEEGPVHDRLFTAAVEVDHRRLSLGVGKTKKEAEQQAAQQAMKFLFS